MGKLPVKVCCFVKVEVAVLLICIGLDALTPLNVFERLAPREINQVAMSRHVLHHARELVVIDVAVAVGVGRLTQLAHVHVGQRQVEVAHLAERKDVAGELSAVGGSSGLRRGAHAAGDWGGVARCTVVTISSYESRPLWSVSIVRKAFSADLNLS